MDRQTFHRTITVKIIFDAEWIAALLFQKNMLERAALHQGRASNFREDALRSGYMVD